MDRRARRSKFLEVEERGLDLAAFRLGLEDKAWTQDGEELVHALEIEGELALPTLEILRIEPRAIHHPYAECAPSLDPVRRMAGTRIGPGFRARAIELMGREKGCTHFLTLVMDLNAAHTLSVFLRMRRTARYAARNAPGGGWMAAGLGVEPRLENACVALRTESRVIAAAKRERSST